MGQETDEETEVKPPSIAVEMWDGTVSHCKEPDQSFLKWLTMNFSYASDTPFLGIYFKEVIAVIQPILWIVWWWN